MRRIAEVLLLAALASAGPAAMASAADGSDILDARKFVEPVMGPACKFRTQDAGMSSGNQVFQIRFRTPGQDQDSPDEQLTLVQLRCSSSGRNVGSIFVARDSTGAWQLLSFAEPVADFDYTDETFSRLRTPPHVSGFLSRHELMNARYLPEAHTVTSKTMWRGTGDAWSSGRWVFSRGAFVLRRFEIDPIFNTPASSGIDQGAPESYVLFQAVAPEQ